MECSVLVLHERRVTRASVSPSLETVNKGRKGNVSFLITDGNQIGNVKGFCFPELDIPQHCRSICNDLLRHNPSTTGWDEGLLQCGCFSDCGPAPGKTPPRYAAHCSFWFWQLTNVPLAYLK